jgi:hypothetical protein
LPEIKRDDKENSQARTDSRKERHDRVEEIETNLAAAGKPCRTFARSLPQRKLYMTNFGERWRELRVTARDEVF